MAHNEQGNIKRGEKWFPEKNYEKNRLKIFFRSESFSIRTYKGRAPASELVLLRGGLPSEIALQGGSLESRIVYRRVGADFEKPKKLFSAHNEQGSIKRGEKWSPEKLLKILTVKIFGPSHSRYVPIKAELPLPSSCC